MNLIPKVGCLALLVIFVWTIVELMSPTTLTLDGVTYHSYGIANADSVKSPKIEYRIPAARIVITVLMFETIAVPVYVIGWDLYDPIGPKTVQEPH